MVNVIYAFPCLIFVALIGFHGEHTESLFRW